jgi:hypothetical protein
MSVSGGAVLLFLCYLSFVASCPLAIRRWRSHDVKELEIAVLRHELGILRRHAKRPAMTTIDRLFLTASSRLLPRQDWRSFIITPETLRDGTDASWRNAGRIHAQSVARRCDMRFGAWYFVSLERTPGGGINGLSASSRALA